MAIHHQSISSPGLVGRVAGEERAGASGPLGSPPVGAAHLGVMNTSDLGLEPLMGVEDLAEYLGVPVQTIYDWRLAGTAPRAFKFGKRLKFAVSDVADWMSAHREAPGE